MSLVMPRDEVIRLHLVDALVIAIRELERIETSQGFTLPSAQLAVWRRMLEELKQ